ncbi:MAG: hypothetical protein FJX33_16120 [Alphaproteobacteria bacterium]|nr:hypothetical protein [Alphaproteobacteria bacterium]
MGSLFKAPKPRVTVQPVTPAPMPEAEASAARLENRDRTSRGSSGTIATSARGLLGSLPDFVTTRRSLLKE